MAPRRILPDALWARMEAVLAEIRPHRGRPPISGGRRFVAAVRYRVRVGSPWRDRPADFGQWDTGYPRFRPWEHQGLWAAGWRRVQPGSGEAKRWAALDVAATIMRAHRQAAGAAPKGAVRKPRPLGAPGGAAPPSCTPSAWRTRPASGSP